MSSCLLRGSRAPRAGRRCPAWKTLVLVLAISSVGGPVAAVAATKGLASKVTVTKGTVPRAKKSTAKVPAPVALPIVAPTTLPPKPSVNDPAGWVPTTFQATLEQWMREQPGIGTVAIAVAAPGHEWFGDASNAPAGAAFHALDRFPALSVTKTFTASLVLRAVTAGRLSLDGPPPELVGLRPPGQPITIRQLLNHTSGLSDYTESPNYRAGTTLLPLDATALATDMPQRSQPGTTVHYANANYLYLQVVLEHVNAKPYDALVAELASELVLPATALEPPDHNGWAAGGSGGIRSTVGDLARWGSALFTPGRVLSPTDEALMSTVDERGVGIGTWPICPCWTDPQGVRRYTAIGHHIVSGGMWYFPATGLTVAVRAEPSGKGVAGLAAELAGRMSGLFSRR